MSFVLEFIPEASAEVECATGDYEAAQLALAPDFAPGSRAPVPRLFSIRCFDDYDRPAIGVSTCPDFHTTSHSSSTSSRHSTLQLPIPAANPTTSRRGFHESMA